MRHCGQQLCHPIRYRRISLAGCLLKQHRCYNKLAGLDLPSAPAGNSCDATDVGRRYSCSHIRHYCDETSMDHGISSEHEEDKDKELCFPLNADDGDHF
mmetsp:Transcript_2440/g.3731  ORF Transcript_2440/g.3731 Transcript_2440/m.3731 type:complete len:99 (-) Transcript_2440:1092-1388(-)